METNKTRISPAAFAFLALMLILAGFALTWHSPARQAVVHPAAATSSTHAANVRFWHGKKGNRMLPASVTASGAGTTAYNITYTLSAGVDSSGNHFYRDATTGRGIIFSNVASSWAVFGVVSTSGVTSGGDDYTRNSSTATTFPLTGWTAINGTPPAPTFTTGGGIGSTNAPTTVVSMTAVGGLRGATLTLAGSGIVSTTGGDSGSGDTICIFNALPNTGNGYDANGNGPIHIFSAATTLPATFQDSASAPGDHNYYARYENTAGFGPVTGPVPARRTKIYFQVGRVI